MQVKLNFSFDITNLSQIITDAVITCAQAVERSAGSFSGIFVGATSPNDEEDELYDEAAEDDGA